MKNVLNKILIFLISASFLIGSYSFAVATEVAQYPTGVSYTNWPSVWTPLPGVNDPAGDTTYAKLDFVGTALNPGGFFAQDANYLYFRAKVATNDDITTSTYSDTIFVFIDVAGFNYNPSLPAGSPDYALAWDNKGFPKTEHGLEFQVAGTSAYVMNDVDDNIGKKISPPDINETGNGYVRTIDHVGSAFVDFAVSRNYLTAYSVIGPTSTINVAFGSVREQTDHNYPSTDITSNSGPILLGGEPAAVPEPSTLSGAFIGISFALKKLLKKYRAG